MDFPRFRRTGSIPREQRVSLSPRWRAAARTLATTSSRGEYPAILVSYIRLTRCSPTENQLLKFISYFRGPILYVMELAVLLAGGLQDWIDFGVIIGILMMNAIVGWYQEK